MHLAQSSLFLYSKRFLEAPFIINLIRNRIKHISIIWYGGEPLLYPQVIEELTVDIQSICCKNNVGYSCSMITYGYLIDENAVVFFKRIKLSSIQITIDGNEKTHNSRRKLKNGGRTYNQIINGIALLKDSNISTFFRVNIDKSNINEYNDVQNMIKETASFAKCYPALVTIEERQSKLQRSMCFPLTTKKFFTII